MKFRQGDEWQECGGKLGRDEEVLLEAVEVRQNQPRQVRVLESVLTNEEGDAFTCEEVVECKNPSARTDRWRTYDRGSTFSFLAIAVAVGKSGCTRSGE